MTTSQISLPNPRTWSANDLITTPRLRADVSDAVAFLLQRPAFTGQATNGGTIGNNADTAIQVQSELTDPWNTHVSTATNGATASQIWAPVPGWYLVRNTVIFAPGGTGAYQTAAGWQWTQGGVLQGPFRGAIILNNGSTASYSAQACDLIEMTGSGSPGGSGDYAQPTVWQTSGGGLALQSAGAALPTATLRWVCATSGTQPLPVPPLTSVPSPITSAWLNANVRDAIRFLTYPPICKAHYVAGTATLPSNTLATAAVINLTTVDVDNYGGFTTGASAKYTAPVAGRYFLYGQFTLTTSSTATTYAAGLSVNGGTAQWGDILTYAPASGSDGGATVTKRIRLSAGDTVQLVGSQGSGGALGYASGAINQTRFIAVWESS